MDTTYPVVISVDDTTYNFTEDSLKEFIKDSIARKQTIALDRVELGNLYKRTAEIRGAVYDFFKERYSIGDTEITLDISDVNDLLELIGADKLRNLYTAYVRVTVQVNDIEAIDEDEVNDIINDNLNVEVEHYSVDIEDISIDDVSIA